MKSHFRLARRTTRLAGVEIPAGTTMMLLIGAINRDPARFAAADLADDARLELIAGGE